MGPAPASLSDAVLAGVYMSEQGNLSHRLQEDLYWECVEGAVADAGLDFDQVDGLVGPAPDGLGSRETLPGAAVADALGHPLRFHASTGVGASGQAAGVGLAAMAVAHGMAEAVIVPTAAAGRGKGYTSSDRTEVMTRLAQLGTPYEYVFGMTRAADYALLARRHMHEYGTTSRQLAEVAVAARRWATLHPLSLMGRRGEITAEDVLASPLIADPLHLLDCCPMNQGGGCVVVTSTALARERGRHPAVVIAGWGEGHGYLDPHRPETLTSFAGSVAASHAFSMAGVRPDEVDLAGFADHFTINVIIALEDSGFCAKGDGGVFVEDGALGPGGRLPANTHGGFLSGSHAASCGLFTLIELTTQLRGEAGDRQVPGARLAFASGVGGVCQTQYSAVLARA
jgi:acetyl-CoA acetyltransferase